MVKMRHGETWGNKSNLKALLPYFLTFIIPFVGKWGATICMTSQCIKFLTIIRTCRNVLKLIGEINRGRWCLVTLYQTFKDFWVIIKDFFAPFYRSTDTLSAHSKYLSSRVCLGDVIYYVE